jgi:kynureninase
MSTVETVADMRAWMQVPGPGPYLATHSVGCLPLAARTALERHFLDPWAREGGDAWPAWLAAIDRFRASLAALLGGMPDDYCPQANLSGALARLLGAIPRPLARRRVWLAHEDSFPSLAYVLGRAGLLGHALRLIPREHSPSDPATWAGALDDDVLGALLTHVHSNTGAVAPVSQVAKMCAGRGIYTVVDVAQSAGILPLDVAAFGADAVLGSCIKWLCGGPGAGWLWLRQGLAERLEPVDVGWFSHAEPFAMDIHDFRYAPDARRFWGGTPSVAPYAMAAASLEWLAGIGIDRVRAHNRALAARLGAALPPRWRARLPTGEYGGTLCLDALDPAAAADAAAALRAIGARFDVRGSVLRLSFHLCNGEADADAVAAALSN